MKINDPKQNLQKALSMVIECNNLCVVKKLAPQIFETGGGIECIEKKLKTVIVIQNKNFGMFKEILNFESRRSNFFPFDNCVEVMYATVGESEGYIKSLKKREHRIGTDFAIGYFAVSKEKI